jgi:hypothetical protein
MILAGADRLDQVIAAAGFYRAGNLALVQRGGGIEDGLLEAEHVGIHDSKIAGLAGGLGLGMLGAQPGEVGAVLQLFLVLRDEGERLRFRAIVRRAHFRAERHVKLAAMR